MLPPTTRELDACGIGFVADARGRSSRHRGRRADGLACVKHRGAVAADARTADGAGLLVPIPRALFGDDTGVAVLFVRGDDPGRRSRPAPPPRGWTSSTGGSRRSTSVRSASWRAPRRRTSCRPVPQPERPQPSRGGAPGARLRRRIERTTNGTYVASCSFRTMVYKGLGPADALADFYPDLGDERFGAPFAIFHQRFSTNTLPTWERAAVPDAVPQRRDQRPLGQRAPHAGSSQPGHRAQPASAARTCSSPSSTPRTPTRGSSMPSSSCSCGRDATFAT